MSIQSHIKIELGLGKKRLLIMKKNEEQCQRQRGGNQETESDDKCRQEYRKFDSQAKICRVN